MTAHYPAGERRLFHTLATELRENGSEQSHVALGSASQVPSLPSSMSQMSPRPREWGGGLHLLMDREWLRFCKINESHDPRIVGGTCSAPEFAPGSRPLPTWQLNSGALCGACPPGTTSCPLRASRETPPPGRWRRAGFGGTRTTQHLIALSPRQASTCAVPSGLFSKRNSGCPLSISLVTLDPCGPGR